MRTVIGVAGAGAGGALARWGLSSAIGTRLSGFPWGTLFVRCPARSYSVCCSVVETFRLLEDGACGSAALNVAGNLLFGLVAVAAGAALGRLL